MSPPDVPGAITRIDGLIRQLEEKREELAEPAAVPRAALAGRTLNPAIFNAAERLYLDGHYPQAVFEAGKALIELVKRKSGSALDGSTYCRTCSRRTIRSWRSTRWRINPTVTSSKG